MRRWLLVAAILVTTVPDAALAQSGGIRLAVDGCGYARLSFSRAFSGWLSVHTERKAPFTGLLIFRDRKPGSTAFAAAVVAPAVRTSPMRAPGSESLPAGRYTVVVCSDRASAIRVTLPGFTGWRTVRLTPAPRAAPTITPVGTAELEAGIARGGFPAGARFKLMLLSRVEGLGATAARMCVVPQGEICASQTGGFIPLVTNVGETSSVHGFAAMHAPGPPTDGVLELAGSRAYDGSARNHLVVVSLPTP